jgi:two-component system chemotaxis sensor kinase CheA
MSHDISQFHQVFFEEAQDHLANMEALLLDLDVDNPDIEQLNAIFRAAHSIKGSSGTFGFLDLQDVTHILENLLDRIRKGELPLRSEMIDAFLAAGDVLKIMLGAHRGEDPADPAQVEAICTRLRQLTVQTEASGNAGYGFFEPLSGVTAVASPEASTASATLQAAAVETAYGFFTDTPPVVAEPADPVATKTNQETAYGFFGELPVPAADSTAPAAVDEESGYGFFTDLPAVVPEGTSTVSQLSPEIVAAQPTPVTTKPATSPATSPAVKPAAPAAMNDEAKPAGREARKSAAASGDTSIRVGVDKVDQLINLVGELVITQAMLAQSAQGVDPVVFERLQSGLVQLERNTRDLQESVMSIRMMPMSVVFSRFPRVIRDLSQKLGKQVELKTSGESTELDKGLIERITDPLTHLIRNSLDHGIEMPEERAAKGKSAVGTITLKAYHQSGNIVIEVGDDGAGLNRAKILSKARERGLPVHDGMTDAEVWMLIFEAGFSTADQVTEVSGRGVGMDVVKRNITTMGGRVEIDSMAGIGTRMTVRLPLTLAILDGMSVAAGKDTYIIPLGYVVESLQAEKGMIKSVSGAERLIQVRGEYLPIVVLHEVFKIPQAITQLDKGIMVVVEADGAKAALFLDALVGQHQVVIKSLEANYRKVAGVAGATIMGDGHVALILDIATLVQMGRQVMPNLPKAA